MHVMFQVVDLIVAVVRVHVHIPESGQQADIVGHPTDQSVGEVAVLAGPGGLPAGRVAESEVTGGHHAAGNEAVAEAVAGVIPY